MPREPRELLEWSHRLAAMRECRTTEELLARHGEPAHKRVDPAIEIWHYPLGIASGTLYSIHVAVSGDDAPMAYMALEPTTKLVAVLVAREGVVPTGLATLAGSRRLRATAAANHL